MKKIKNSSKLRIHFIAIILIYLIVTILSYVSVFYRDITVSNIGKKDDFSSDYMVHIDHISINSIKQDNRKYIGKYDTNGDFGLTLNKGEKLIIKVPIYSQVTIGYSRSEDSGIVEMKDLSKTRQIDLYGKDDVVLTHPVTTKFIYYVLALVFLIFIYYILYRIVSILYKSKNKYVQKIINSNIFWIIVIAIVARVYYLKYFKVFYVEFHDTVSYRDFLYYIRPPVYPLLFFISNFFHFFIENAYLVVVFFQMILGVVGVYLFYKNISFFASNKISTLFSILYAMFPSMIFYEHALLSESMSIFLLLLCIRFVEMFLKKQSMKNILLVIFGITLAIFEKPAFIYFIPLIFFFFLLYGLHNNNKRVMKSSFLIVIPICLILVYSFYCFRTRGVFAFSIVPTSYNDGYHVVSGNYYDGSGDIELENDFTYEKYNNDNSFWGSYHILSEKYGDVRIRKFVKQAVSSNKREYIISILKRSVQALNRNVCIDVMSEYSDLKYDKNQYYIEDYLLYEEKIFHHLFFPFTYGFLLMFSFMSMIFVLVQFIKKKKINWLKLGLSSIIICTILTTFINGIDDFDRLTISVIPVTYLLISMWISEIHVHEVVK